MSRNIRARVSRVDEVRRCRVGVYLRRSARFAKRDRTLPTRDVVSPITHWTCVAAIALGACNAPPPPTATGGVTLPNPSAESACPLGIAVVSSDYVSSNVSVLDAEGSVVSESIISSGSASVGLNAALSGDVVLPLTAPLSHRLVLINRYPNSVITWVDPGSATVLHQLQVGTGFISNPHDYLELPGHKGYLSRFETNKQPGREPHDGGGDLSILDTEAAKSPVAFRSPPQETESSFHAPIACCAKVIMCGSHSNVSTRSSKTRATRASLGFRSLTTPSGGRSISRGGRLWGFRRLPVGQADRARVFGVITDADPLGEVRRLARCHRTTSRRNQALCSRPRARRTARPGPGVRHRATAARCWLRRCRDVA